MSNLFSPGTTFAGLYFSAILTSNGVPAVSTSVTVYESDDSTAATLYTDQTKASTTANPVSTDSLGNLLFYADPGLYDLSFSIGGVPTTLTVMVNPFYPDAAWNMVVDSNGPFSPLSGDSRFANVSAADATYNLPAPTLGARFKITVDTVGVMGHRAIINTPSGVIQGLGLAGGQTYIYLGTQGAFVELHSDDTNYHIVGGQQDTGWLNVSLTSDHSWSLPDGYSNPIYRKAGSHVIVHGAATGGTGNGTLLSLSSAYAISNPSRFAQWAYQGTGSIFLPWGAFVNTDGTIYLDGWDNSNQTFWIELDYVVD